MKKYIRSSEDTIMRLLYEASSYIMDVCEKRGYDEYIDDTRWGEDRFEIPIFEYTGSMTGGDPKVASFVFIYEPDEDGTMEEQMHIQLDEFMQEWYKLDEDNGEDIEGDEYIAEAVAEETEYCHKYFFTRVSQDKQACLDEIVENLEEGKYLVEGEDFTREDILKEMEKYSWN